MNVFKYELYNKYHNLEFDECINMIDTNIRNGYGIDDILIDLYISCLIKKHEFEKAYKLTKWLEKTGGEKVYNHLYHLYYHCYKFDDAERIISKMQYKDVDKYILIKLKMDQGKISDARKIIREALKENQTPQLLELKKEIDNYYKHNDFLNIGYDDFARQGKKIETGHVLYLKHKPESLNPTIDNDEKSDRRPYLVWKCIGDKIFLFPMTSKVKQKHYKLRQRDYANSKFDRAIIDNLCFTTKDNILSVNDKVHEDDFKPLFGNLYRRMYLCPSTEIREYYKIFMKDYMKDIRKNNVVMLKDRNTGKERFEFVLDVDENNYTLIEIDNKLNVIKQVPEKYSKNRLFYRVLILTGDEINKVRNNLPKEVLGELIAKENQNNNKQKEQVRKKVKKRVYHR